MNEARDPIREAHAAARRSPIDTIREALMGVDEFPGLDAALAALSQVEHQLDRMTKTAEELRRRWDDETTRAVAAEQRANELAASLDETAGYANRQEQRANDLADALREIVALYPGWGAKGSSTLAIARAALDRHTHGAVT